MSARGRWTSKRFGRALLPSASGLALLVATCGASCDSAVRRAAPGAAGGKELSRGRAAAAPFASPAAPDAGNRLQLLTDVTYVASLVHFIDSLAGTSGGKTIPVYRDLWVERHGAPHGEDLVALRKFVVARRTAAPAPRCPAFPEGVGEPDPDWRSRFLFAALEARDVEDFLDRVRQCLPADEARALAESLAYFREGFDPFWRNGAFLRRFDERFRTYLATGPLPSFLGEVARFFDVDPSAAPPPILCFVLLPRDGSTHAQALGRRLLVEVRPHDDPVRQVQVVAHEESHYLFRMIPRSRLEALEGRARAAGPKGERIWQLLQEALPTALGQGLAVARLDSESFDPQGTWYHLRSIDRLAKQIYPIVRREMQAGRTVDGPFLDEVLDLYAREPVPDDPEETPPVGTLDGRGGPSPSALPAGASPGRSARSASPCSAGLPG